MIFFAFSFYLYNCTIECIHEVTSSQLLAWSQWQFFLKETFIQLFASYRLDFLKALKTWSLVEIDDSS